MRVSPPVACDWLNKIDSMSTNPEPSLKNNPPSSKFSSQFRLEEPSRFRVGPRIHPRSKYPYRQSNSNHTPTYEISGGETDPVRAVSSLSSAAHDTMWCDDAWSPRCCASRVVLSRQQPPRQCERRLRCSLLGCLVVFAEVKPFMGNSTHSGVKKL